MTSELEQVAHNPKMRCCSLQFWSGCVYTLATLLWVFFSVCLNFLSKEWCFGILMAYSLYWLLLLFFKPISPFKGSWFVFWLITRVSCFFSDPFYENDYYRYIWDGIVAYHLENPLVVAPLEVRHGSPAFVLDLETRLDRQTMVDQRMELMPEKERDELLSEINFPESPSIYGPSAQVFLALQSVPLQLLHKFYPEVEIPVTWRIQCLRFFFILIDLLSCFVLLALIKTLGLHPSFLLIYLFCPVLLKEVGNSLHIDLLSTLFLLSSFVLLLRKSFLISGLCLALATGVKMYALVMFPIYLIWSRSPKLAFAFISCLLGLYAPFVLTGGDEIWVGTKYFSHLWSMNDFFPAILREIFYRTMEVKWEAVDAYPIGVYERSQIQWLSRSLSLACFAFFFALQAWWAFKDKDEDSIKMKRVSWILFAVFWFSPVQNPWYYLWGLPFFVLSDRKVILFMVGMSQFYLFNFYLEPSSHLSNPFQWWVVAPHLAAGVLCLFLIFKNRKQADKKMDLSVS